MFKKKKKNKGATPQDAVIKDHPSFEFSVLSEEMRSVARDFSTLQALASLQKKGAPQKAPVAPPPVPKSEPKPEPAPKKQEPRTSTKKKSRISKPVLFGGVVFLLILLGGGGYIVYTLGDTVDTEDPVVVTPPRDITAPPDNQTPVEPPVSRISSGKDTDTDGLTDAEERLFKTDIRNPDTDEDTFLDNNEVFHGYDPAIPDPATLDESSSVERYVVEGTLPYSFLKMRTWSVEPQAAVSTGPEVTRILTTSGAEFRITRYAQEDTMQTLGDWYDANATREWLEDHGNAVEFQSQVTKTGYPARISPDKRFAFFSAGGSVFVLEYDLRVEQSSEYPTIFQMMFNNLIVIEE